MRAYNSCLVVTIAIMMLAVSCGPLEGPDSRPLAVLTSALVGVPQDGYPSYQERLQLVAVNRARSDPNNVALETAASCSTQHPAQAPLAHNHNGARGARFHCQNLIMNGCGLSHNSYCTLKSDIGTTNCDGSDSCACQPGTEAFNCTTLGGHGTDPWTRAGYFGFGASGEVGAASYGDGWQSVVGWVTECPPNEGHRTLLTDGGYNEIGLGWAEQGGGCWADYAFGDLGTGGTPYLMPAGIHRPETGSGNFDFLVNLADPGGVPTSLNVVIDGTCHAMALEIGTPANGTYKATVQVSSGCSQYYFLARDHANARKTYPEVGAWGVGSCTDYQANALTANCETCNPGETKPCGLGKCAGTQDCNASGSWDPCNGPAPDPVESCNGIDDDCDGVIPANEADADGDGYRVCQGDCDDHNLAVHPGAVELCNGIDDNCDGNTDEGCACKGGDTQPCGLGKCAGKRTCTVTGTWGACDGPSPDAVESCNGIDDDCDGVIPANEADSDGDGYRVCQGDCDDHNPAVHPGAVELCNGIDDNCDGNTDEGCACTEGGSRSCGIDQGACKPGTQHCTGGTWGACEGAVGPVTEICGNSIDDNCDGQTDENCGCTDGQSRACDLGQTPGECSGEQQCLGGSWGPCQGSCGAPQQGVLIEGSCGCSSATGGPPSLLLAILVLLWRRRRGS